MLEHQDSRGQTRLTVAARNGRTGEYEDSQMYSYYSSLVKKGGPRWKFIQIKFSPDTNSFSNTLVKCKCQWGTSTVIGETVTFSLGRNKDDFFWVFLVTFFLWGYKDYHLCFLVIMDSHYCLKGQSQQKKSEEHYSKFPHLRGVTSPPSHTCLQGKLEDLYRTLEL